MQTPFEEFCATLKRTFMLDVAEELDFGIYRIMNLKRKDIEDFLDNRLKGMVEQEIANNISTDYELKKRELDELVATLTKLRAPVDDNPNVIEKRRELDNMGDPVQMQASVFTHLDIFFNRYYDKGDFMSKRRYSSKSSESKYAIPYNGEEVKLYWANQDQYYIKTGDTFHNYRFSLTNRRIVEFTLKDVQELELNNNKQPKKDWEHRFKLNEEIPLELTEDGVLHINFTFELMAKSNKQATLDKAAIASIYKLSEEGKLPLEFIELVAEKEDKERKKYTLISKHLATYTAKNTMDYFIHKDLKGFLCRELDFYIKNDVLNVDDMMVDTVKRELAVAKTIKAIGTILITWLAQLENYQKRLWLKKKFVIQSDYCITLDRVPKELYGEICENDDQREEWVHLFSIDDIKGDLITEGYSVPLTEKFLNQNQQLVLDTKFFDKAFKQTLMQSFDDIDGQCNGLLIYSENFQALRLIQNKFRKKVKCIYADPPYNTSASEILYKNSYKDSSWLSLMHDRLILGAELLSDDGLQCTTIDDVEESKLKLLLASVYGEQPYSVSIRIKPSGRPIPKGFAISHEYALFNKNNSETSIARLEHSDEQMARYRETDEKGSFMWELLRKAGSNSFRENRPTMYFPIYLNPETGKMRVPDMEYDDDKEAYDILEQPAQNEVAVYPIKDNGKDEGCWYFGLERVKKEISEFKAERQNNGSYFIYRRRRKNEGVQPTTFWDDSKFSATEHGTDLLKKLFGKQESFSYPKSIHAVEECFKVMGIGTDDLALDYFAGSGTTAHAIINLNADGGNRKYILIEMGRYFETVTKPRVEKIIYSKDWVKGKPKSRQGVSQCFKYMRLEQYEETLNNLDFSNGFNTVHGLRFNEDYFLNYKLDVETEGSLFGKTDIFKHPFAGEENSPKLMVIPDKEEKGNDIDLPETFNYLLGLYVEKECWPQAGLQVIQGHTRNSEDTLVIWRDVDTVDNDALTAFAATIASDELKRYRRIYVNGENTLAASLPPSVAERVMSTDEEFQRLMFAED